MKELGNVLIYLIPLKCISFQICSPCVTILILSLNSYLGKQAWEMNLLKSLDRVMSRLRDIPSMC